MKRALIIPLVAILAVAAWFVLRARTAHGPEPWSGVLEAREIQVGSRVGGRVVEVLVREGQMVDAGAVLVRLERREWQAERDQLQARLAQAEADAARLSHGYRPEEIAQAEAASRQAAASLAALREGPRAQEREQAEADYRATMADARNAEANFQRLDTLFKTGDIAAQAHDDARSRRDLAAAKAESARQRMELLRAGTRDEDIRAGEQRLRQAQANAELFRKGFRQEDIDASHARVAEARAQLEANAIRLDETEVRASARSRVESVSVRPGDLAVSGKPVATLLELDQVWARLYVPEPQLGLIHTGDTLNLRADTYPDRTYTGIVEQINSKAEYLPRNIQTLEGRSHLVFGVRIRPKDPQGELKPGMTVFATPATP
ncbi:MAG: HlyD family efflux transporter periplasmic adaptor subunit [Acidobacteriota bacterium]